MMMPSMDPNPFIADYVAYNVDNYKGDPVVYLSLGDGFPVYQHPLVAEPDPTEAMDMGYDDLFLLKERFRLDPNVNRALEAVGDRGVAANVLRLQQFPTKRRGLAEMKQQIK